MAVMEGIFLNIFFFRRAEATKRFSSLAYRSPTDHAGGPSPERCRNGVWIWGGGTGGHQNRRNCKSFETVEGK